MIDYKDVLYFSVYILMCVLCIAFTIPVHSRATVHSCSIAHSAMLFEWNAVEKTLQKFKSLQHEFPSAI